MKKTFTLTATNKKPERVVEAVKHEIRKYIKREKRKPLDDAYDFWHFDCKFGKDVNSAEVIAFTEITTCIDQAVSENYESFYIELLASPAKRTPKEEL